MSFSVSNRGLADDSKRRDVLKYLRGKKPDIILLQDIHVNHCKVNRFILEWGLQGLVAPGTSLSRGVAILFNNTFEYKIKEDNRCPLGNYVLANVCILEQNVMLGSVYGKHDDDPGFHRNLFLQLGNMGNDEMILERDWNLVINPDLNYKNYRNTNNKQARLIVLEEMEHLGLVDIWCKQHGKKKSYTWSTNKYKKKTRIDFFLVSETLANRSETCKIESGHRTDHCMITLSVSKGIPKRGNGCWKCNTSLLKDLEYSKLVLRAFRQCLDLYAALPYNGENIDRLT